jgi:hypothetical protein
MPARPKLLAAVARSEQILALLPSLFVAPDQFVRAIDVAEGRTDIERARDAATRDALFLLEHVDGLLEVEPGLIDEIEDDHKITLTREGLAFVAALRLERARAASQPSQTSPVTP